MINPELIWHTGRQEVTFSSKSTCRRREDHFIGSERTNPAPALTDPGEDKIMQIEHPGMFRCVNYIIIQREGKHMWKFWKKQEKPKTKIDTLSEKVDKTVAETEKDLQGLSKTKPSKREKSVDDAIVNLKGDLKNIEKKK
jgi:hypothetical protein